MSVTLYHRLNSAQQRQLLTIAQQAIRDYLHQGVANPPSLDNYDSIVQEIGACFVTLKVKDQLQGCLGTLEATKPLALEVYDKAFACTHQDNRFTPLMKNQQSSLTVEISVLSKPKPLVIESEIALLHYLANNKLGVMLREHQRTAVFLPQVWQQLPQPEDFIRHLKAKAKWPENYWSDAMQVSTFDVQIINSLYV